MQRRKKPQHLAHIRVVGLGGGGRTAVNSMIAAGIRGVDFITADVDAQALELSRAPSRVLLGNRTAADSATRGNPERGKNAALGSRDSLQNALFGSDLVFLVAGLGGGTGSGAAPVVAQIAQEQQALVVAIVTHPFSFEDRRRIAAARETITRLKNWTNTLIVIPGDRLMTLADGRIGFHEAYHLAAEIWNQSVQGIHELVNRSGLINVDFADVRAVISAGGEAIITTGQARGRHRARDAAGLAAQSQLLGTTIDDARGLLFNISGGNDMSLIEVEEAAEIITGRAHPAANVIFGASVHDQARDELRITVVATGLNANTPGHKVRRSLRQFLTPGSPPAGG